MQTPRARSEFYSLTTPANTQHEIEARWVFVKRNKARRPALRIIVDGKTWRVVEAAPDRFVIDAALADWLSEVLQDELAGLTAGTLFSGRIKTNRVTEVQLTKNSKGGHDNLVRCTTTRVGQPPNSHVAIITSARFKDLALLVERCGGQLQHHETANLPEV